jgi:hypothetical protein
MPKKKVLKPITDYWHNHYVNYDTPVGKWGMCSLCGNTGLIDTRETATSPAGFKCGKINFCICPNGQTMRYEENK